VHPAPKPASPTPYDLARELEQALLAMRRGKVTPGAVLAAMLDLWSYDETDAIECRHMREAARLVRLRFGLRP